MTNVFSDFDDSQDEVTLALEALKQKYTKEDGTLDTEGLLKKAANADVHIPRIERENAQFRENTKVASTLEEILAKIEAKRNDPGQLTQDPPAATVDKSSDKDLDKYLDAKLQAYEARKSRERNLQIVREQLQSIWGSDAPLKLKARAKELGESEEFLDQLAQERPQTFLALVKGTSATPTTSVSAPRNSMRSNPTTSTTKTYKDFEKLRKENPKLYKSKAVQDEMFRLTAEYAAQGKSFTDTK